MGDIMDDNARRNFQKLAENQEAQKKRAFKNDFYDPSGSEFMKTIKRIRQENIRREELESKHQDKKREEDDFQDTESFFENYELKLSKITKRKNNAKEIKIIKRRLLIKKLIMIGLPILIVIIIALVLIFTVFK
jgi:hypothetical protein